MKPVKFFLFIQIFIFCTSPAWANYQAPIFKTLQLPVQELPTDFRYGQVPPAIKSVIKNNPWQLDQKSINKLTSRIYPGGSANSISALQMNIITRKTSPFNDDIVCYFILLKKGNAALEEIKKMTKFAQSNKDRVILITQENLAILMHVDDVSDYTKLQDLAYAYKLKLKTKS